MYTVSWHRTCAAMLALCLGLFGFVAGADAQRSSDGLLALYGFDEGSGSVVRDVSNVGSALDLTIHDANRVSWLNDGLRVDSSTLIASPNAATKLTDAIKASGALTFEAWVTPTRTNQRGPARIVTLSTDSGNRNATLGADNSRYVMRLRTTSVSNNGMPSLDAASGSLKAQRAHVVYTRDASGNAKIFVDGLEIKGGTKSGSLSNWNGSYRFGLGNEIHASRPWLGTYHLVAVYDRALTSAEVQSHFAAGP
ncbi:MAG: LamG domain-containing protein, partial [Pseudomonadota bacterium]